MTMKYPIANLLVPALLAMTLCAFASPVLRAQAATGSVTGQVSDSESGVYLYAVQVEIAGTSMTTVTDREGQFRFDRLPAGTCELVFNYTGSRTQRKTVEVRPGAETSLSINLRPEIVTLEKFVVTGEREGDAASMARQRNAANVTNVIAIDALGRMTNENTGELLMRLPGIVAEMGDHGEVESVTIRGIIGEFNSMTVDGVQQGNTYTERRVPRTDMLSGALFEEIEVVKSHTPDMPADGLGGAVNIKTRGPLSAGRRGVYYRLGARYAAPFYDHTPMRDGRLIHPLFNITYNDVFSIGSGKPNLGVSLNLLYNERASSYYRTRRSYERTTESPAFVWDYWAEDVYNNRKQMQASLKLEYKLSPGTKFWASLLYADSADPWHTARQMRATVSENTQHTATLNANGQPAGTGSILPGYTDGVTSVWGPTAAGRNSTRLIAQSYIYAWDARERQITLGGEHRDGPLNIDYTIGYFRSVSDHNTPMSGDRPAGGVFFASVSDPWWRLDTRESMLRPSFTQFGGASSIYDPASYTALQLTARDYVRFDKNFNAGINAKYSLPLPLRPLLKTGIYYRNRQNGQTKVNSRRWTSNAEGLYAQLSDPAIVTSTDLRSPPAKRIPWVSVADAAADIYDNPGRWAENIYYNVSNAYSGERKVTENITAAYAQTQFRAGRFFALAGARMEHTGIRSQGRVLSRIVSTTAERAADPVAAAKRDYNNPVSLESDYTHWLPSVHLKYTITKSLIARLSWSNSIGRPRFADLFPSTSVNNADMILSVNNPGLKPQQSENWDLMLEYYYNPLGQLSAGYFRKNLSKFIVRDRGGVVPDDPDGPYYEYAGYDIVSEFNGGDAKLEGWELSWRQRLTFLPGLLRGLTVSANYTTLKTEGDYGSTSSGATITSLAGFVPRSANFVVNYGYRKFSVRLMANHRSSYLHTYASDPTLALHAYSRTVWNLSLNYEMVRRRITFFCDFDNLTDQPVRYYTYSKARLAQSVLHDRVINFGIRGAF